MAKWNFEKSKEHPDGVTMEMVNQPGYFRNLKPNVEILDFAKVLIERGYDVRILSKASFTAIQEKVEWLQAYLPEISKEKMHFVPLNKNKSDFIPSPTPFDILIDDYNPNLKEFKGTAVKCVTDKNTINPEFPWIDMKNPPFKNLDVITTTLVKEWVKLKNKSDVDMSLLQYIKDRSAMSSEDFINICESFNYKMSTNGKNECTFSLTNEIADTDVIEDIDR